MAMFRTYIHARLFSLTCCRSFTDRSNRKVNAQRGSLVDPSNSVTQVWTLSLVEWEDMYLVDINTQVLLLSPCVLLSCERWKKKGSTYQSSIFIEHIFRSDAEEVELTSVPTTCTWIFWFRTDTSMITLAHVSLRYFAFILFLSAPDANEMTRFLVL